jgi:hypothetical protein
LCERSEREKPFSLALAPEQPPSLELASLALTPKQPPSLASRLSHPLSPRSSPGWFILALCIVIFFLVIFCFDPKPSPSYIGNKSNISPTLAAAADDTAAGAFAPPNSTGLAVLLIIFVIHFFSFAIQETITTPYVLSAYDWTQTDVNLLFVGVGVVSLVTSVAIK